MKVVLVGDTQVGKTCVVSRLTCGEFRPENPATVGAAFQNHTIDTPANGSVSLQIWDTAGQEKYRALAPMYYRSASIAVLFFDLTNLATFQSLDNWISELQEKTTREIKLFLVGNKADLSDERVVSRAAAEEFAKRHGIVNYMETSAKTGEGVLDLFTSIASTKFYLDTQHKPNDAKPQQLTDDKKKKKCC